MHGNAPGFPSGTPDEWARSFRSNLPVDEDQRTLAYWQLFEESAYSSAALRRIETICQLAIENPWSFSLLEMNALNQAAKVVRSLRASQALCEALDAFAQQFPAWAKYSQ